MKNLLYNPSFELWTYPNSAPNGYSFAGAGESYIVQRESSTLYEGGYAAKITVVNTSYGYLFKSLAAINSIGWWRGKYLAFGAWVYDDVGSLAYLQINDGIGNTLSRRHSGYGWEWLSATRAISTSATTVNPLFMARTVIGSSHSVIFDSAVALEGCWVPQTPYDFEDVEYRLGPTSATSIPLYPEEGMELGKYLMHNTQRAADGHLYGYEFGTYHKSSFPVQFMPASDAAIVNSWWESQAKLLLFVTSGPVTAVHSCMIMGENCPMNQVNKPYDDRFKGTIPLEGY